MTHKYIYNSYGDWIRTKFPFRVQKIAVDAQLTCPNRDGYKATGGCIYCLNQAFSPNYCQQNLSITQQLEEGEKFFATKYPTMKYLAYFQAHSNTYAPIDHLKAIYNEALDSPDIVGLVIATRPDCISEPLLDFLEKLNSHTFIIIEYGVESTSNKTLKLINRQHSFQQAADALRLTKERGITTGAHFILGLPGETEEFILNQTKLINNLNIDILKLHQLQILKGTKLELMWQKHKFHTFQLNEYIQLIAKIIPKLRPDIVIERFTAQAPDNLLIAPKWGVKNHVFTQMLNKKLTLLNTYQGAEYSTQ